LPELLITNHQRQSTDRNVNVNVNLYNALSHSASNAPNEPKLLKQMQPKLAMLSSGSRRHTSFMMSANEKTNEM